MFFCIAFVSLLDCSAPRRATSSHIMDAKDSENTENVDLDEKPPVVLLTALVKDLASVSTDVWQNLGGYCSSARGRYTIHIVYKTGDPALPTSLYLGNCMEMSLVQQDSIVERGLTGLDNKNKEKQKLRLDTFWHRIAKLGQLRSWQRTFLSMPYAEKVDAVAVVDLDAMELPSAEGLWSIVDDTLHPTGDRKSNSSHGTNATHTTIYCANGFHHMFFVNVFYDTFAFVDLQGNWLYGSLLKQIWYYYKFANKPAEVHTCFGGMAVYDARVYFKPECNYFDSNRTTPYADRYGFFCEHVLFQECIREQLGDENVHIVVDPRLDYQRSFLVMGTELGTLCNKFVLLVAGYIVASTVLPSVQKRMWVA